MTNPIQESVLNKVKLLGIKDMGAIGLASTTMSAIKSAKAAGEGWLAYRDELNDLENRLKRCTTRQCIDVIKKRFNQIKNEKRKKTKDKFVTSIRKGLRKGILKTEVH